MVTFTWENPRREYTLYYFGKRMNGHGVELLKESCGRMEWDLKRNISLQGVVENFPYGDDRYSRPWINSNKRHVHQAREEDKFEWDLTMVSPSL